MASSNTTNPRPLSPWGNKCSAKININHQLDDTTSKIHLMTVEQIHKEWANDYKIKLFLNNYRSLLKQRETNRNKNNTKTSTVEKWRTRSSTSKGHDLLYKLRMDPTSGIHNMTTQQVYDSSPLFKCYEFDEFKKYDKKMIELTKTKSHRIAKENRAFHQDRFLYPRNTTTLHGEPFWDTHAAKDLLAEDVTNGVAAELAPMDLWQTRDEYKAFNLRTFRKHIYQEQEKQRSAVYWQYKRNKVAQKEHNDEMECKKSDWCQTKDDCDFNEMVAKWKDWTSTKWHKQYVALFAF